MTAPATLGRRQWLRWQLGLAAAVPAWRPGAAVPALGPGAAVPALGPGAASQAGATLAWRERALLGFGTTLWLRAAHAEAGRAERALDEAVGVLRHIERQMSLFRADSAIVRLNRDGYLPQPDADLLRVLQLSRQVAARSGGAFDISVQPLWAAWQRAQSMGRRPTGSELAQARARVDWRGVHATPAAVRLRPGMALTLNGIAQGYAAGRVREVLQRQGIAHALLDVGEWQPMGHSPDGSPWRLGLADPRDSARVLEHVQSDGRAIAVSTDATLRFGRDPADARDHHILDPRSGRSPPHLSAVAVLAASPALADALTKVMFMGNADQARARARRWGVGVVVVDKRGRVSRDLGTR